MILALANPEPEILPPLAKGTLRRHYLYRTF